MNNIILCGLPGCGKTTVGRLLAQHRQSDFIDLDTLIESLYAERSGESFTCRQIYAKKGREYFRQLEHETLKALAQKPQSNTIIALAGGVVEVAENIEILKSLGTVVYLKADRHELYKRITNKGLPAYLDPQDPWRSFEKLVEKRLPAYAQAAHVVVDTASKGPEEIVSLLMKMNKNEQV